MTVLLDLGETVYPSLALWQIALDGTVVAENLLGKDTGVGILAYEGLGLPGQRTADQDLPNDHGVIALGDFHRARSLVFTLCINGAGEETCATGETDAAADAWRQLRLLAGVWQARRGDVTLELAMTDGTTYVLIGRPRRFEADTTALHRGYVKVAAEFLATDPRMYAVDTDTSNIIYEAGAGDGGFCLAEEDDPDGVLCLDAIYTINSADLLEPFSSLTNWTTVAGTPTVVSARNGQGAELDGTDRIEYPIPLADQSAVLTLGFAFRAQALGGTAIFLRLMSDSGATEHVRLTCTVSGALSISRAGVAAATSADVITAGTWHYIEVGATLGDSPNGTWEVRCDGTTVIGPTTGLDTKNAGTKSVFDSIDLSAATTNARYDDLYLVMGSIHFFGDPGDLSSPPTTGDGNVLCTEPNISGEVDVTNEGNTDTYPTTTFYGPAEDPVITNATTDRSLGFIVTLGAGERLTVNHKTRVVTFYTSAVDPGTVSPDLIGTDADFWPLVPGVNHLVYRQAASVAALAVPVWRPAWL